MSESESVFFDPPKKRVALFGTMKTDWRTSVKAQLESNGFIVLDNTDPRWHSAETAEQIKPLLAQDLTFMQDADAVLWHHDADTEGRTARIELGLLPAQNRPAIIHVDTAVPSREYMRAFVELHPQTLQWANTLEEAVILINALS